MQDHMHPMSRPVHTNLTATNPPIPKKTEALHPRRRGKGCLPSILIGEAGLREMQDLGAPFRVFT